MSKILKIDTSDNKKIIVGIEDNGKIQKEITADTKTLKTESALFVIKKILKDSNLEIQDIKGIDVNVIAGSYTGIRVGAAIANTLGFLLDIPINGEKIGVLTEPRYNK